MRDGWGGAHQGKVEDDGRDREEGRDESGLDGDWRSVRDGGMNHECAHALAFGIERRSRLVRLTANDLVDHIIRRRHPRLVLPLLRFRSVHHSEGASVVSVSGLGPGTKNVNFRRGH